MTAAAAWALPPLSIGEFGPPFALPTRTNPNFHLTAAAGRYILLGFMPRDPGLRAAAAARLAENPDRFDGRKLAAFLIATDPAAGDTTVDALPGLRWFFDPENRVGPLYGSGAEAPAWILLDPQLRLLDRAALDAPDALFAHLAALPPVAEHAGAPLVAPVLVCPRVFEPEFCQRLIDIYEREGGRLSGVMRDVDGRTVGVLDRMKRRRDVTITDAGLRQEIIARLQRTVLPMIARTFHFQATRIERYLVACYDAAEGGYFQPHRDNETLGTQHRRFAVSINLNAEAYEGGDLRFPEFGPRTYRAPTGGAVVFACGLQHEATPVTRGRRFAFLPFLFSEADQLIREANLSRMAAAGDAGDTP